MNLQETAYLVLFKATIMSEIKLSCDKSNKGGVHINFIYNGKKK